MTGGIVADATIGRADLEDDGGLLVALARNGEGGRLALTGADLEKIA